MTHNLEQTNEKRRGRPISNDVEAYEAICKNAATKKKFDALLASYVHRKIGMKDMQDAYSEDLKSVSEAYKISKGWLNATINAMAGDKQEEIAGKYASVAEYLSELDDKKEAGAGDNYDEDA